MVKNAPGSVFSGEIEWFEYDQGHSGHSFRAILCFNYKYNIRLWRYSLSLGNAENRLSLAFLKGAVCRTLTLLKHKNAICLQTFRKHVKLTYLFI